MIDLAKVAEIEAELQRRLAPGAERLETRIFGTKVVPPMVCGTGLRLSIQAGVTHQCAPKNDVGPYTHVEVCAPDLAELRPYRGYTSDEFVIYYCVPIGLVAEIIATNGGFP